MNVKAFHCCRDVLFKHEMNRLTVSGAVRGKRREPEGAGEGEKEMAKKINDDRHEAGEWLPANH